MTREYPYSHPDVRGADADRLRDSFERGSSWTKDRAKREWGWSDRRLRLAVAALREKGYPVISTSEQGSVYRKANSLTEVEQFIERELVSRSRSLEQQIRALRDGANTHFGADQLRLAV